MAKAGGRWLTAKAYTTVGGVAGAIEKTAEDAYERLTAVQKDAARRLFLSLVTPGEGQVDTRARSAFPNDPQQLEIIDLFANPKTRLLVTSYETVPEPTRPGREAHSTVEVAHEALIKQWKTLRDWVGASRQKLRDRTSILRSKGEWEENGQDEKFLLDPGVHLERGRALLANPGDVAVDDIRDYVSRSIEKDKHRLAAERGAALEVQKRIAEAAEQQKTAAAQMRIADAERQAREAAEVAATEAKARAAAEAQARAAADDAAREAKARAQAQGQAREAADEAARQAKRTAEEEKKAAVAGKRTARVALIGFAAALLVAGLAGWQFVQARASAAQARASAAQARTNLLAAQISQSRYLALVAQQKHGEGDAGTAIPLALDILPDATIGDDRPNVPEAVSELDGAWRDLREQFVLAHQFSVRSAAFSLDGRRLVTTSGNTAQIWNPVSGQPLGDPLVGHAKLVIEAGLSADGERVVIRSDDNTAQIWDVVSGKPIGAPFANVTDAAFGPDGNRIVTTSLDKTAQIWDVASGKPIGEPLKGHEGAVVSARFSPDGTRVVTASSDATARIWDAASGQPIGEPLGNEQTVISAEVSPDGRRVVTVSGDYTARIGTLRAASRLASPSSAQYLVRLSALIAAASSPPLETLPTFGTSRTARKWAN
jgi:hypothetical protein